MAYRKKTLGFIERILSTASSGGTLSLANNSRTYQQITGTQAHTVVLPQANAASPNECPVGLTFVVLNRSTQAITVNYFGGSLAKSLAANSQATFRLVDKSTSAGTWDVSNEASGGGANNSLTAEQKLSALSALGSFLSQDDSVISNVVKISPEEIGGNFYLTKSGLPTAIAEQAQFSLNGFLYTAGGATNPSGNSSNTTYRYNETFNYWLSRANLPYITYGSLGWASASKGYAIGGFDSGAGPTGNRLEASEYDDTTNAWTQIASMSAKRYDPQGGFDGTYGIVTGGTALNSGDATAVTELYDRTANAWRVRAPITQVVLNGGSFVDKDSIYITGGYSGNNTAVIVGYIQKFNNALNYFIQRASFTNARSSHTSWSSMGRGYLAGGSGVSIYLDTQEYNIVENSYKTLLNAPTTNTRNQSCGRGDCGHVQSGWLVGGQDGGAGPYITNVYSYISAFFVNIPLPRKTAVTPSSLYVSVALNSIASSVPVRLRTDGDSWQYFEANKDSALKLNESLSKKFLESGKLFVAGGDSANGASTYNLNEFYDSVANTWTAKQTFTTGKTVTQSFKLSGYGHLAGGSTSVTTVATNDRYNEDTNAWDTRTALTVAKASGAGYNYNGYGYAVAGGSGGLNNTNYRYDSALDSWSTKAPITSVAAQPGSYVLDGRSYVVNGSSTGSFGNNQNLNQQYNDILDAWATKTGSSNGRTGPGSYSMNNFGFISGGFYSGSFSQTSTERYDPATDSWTGKAANSSGRSALGGASVSGAGYVYGGQVSTTPSAVVDKYNDAANVNTAVASLGTARTATTTSFTPGPYRQFQLEVGLPTYLSALGSAQWITKSATMLMAKVSQASFTIGENLYQSDGNGGGVQTELQKYSPYTDAWIYETVFPYANQEQYSQNSAVCGLGHRFGDGAAATNQLHYKYEPFSKAWRSAAAYPTLVYQHAAASLNEYLYGMGGNVPGTGLVANVNRYSDTANSWVSRTAMPSTRQTATGGAYNGFMYVIGGTASALTTQYNDAADSWLAKQTLPTNAQGAALVLVNGKLTATGGFSGAALATAQSFDDNANIWIVKSNMPAGRYGQGNGTINGTGYLAGGSDGSNPQNNLYALVPAIKNIVLGAALRIS